MTGYLIIDFSLPANAILCPCTCESLVYELILRATWVNELDKSNTMFVSSRLVFCGHSEKWIGNNEIQLPDISLLKDSQKCPIILNAPFDWMDICL